MMFMFEYALARLVMAWGVKPEAMIGTASASSQPPASRMSCRSKMRCGSSFLRGELMQQVPAGADAQRAIARAGGKAPS